jgi:hypothetical protein
MSATPTPHNFLLYLRTRRPRLARPLDGARGLSFLQGAFEAAIDPDGWHGRELAALGGPMAEAVRAYFGAGATLRIVPAPADPERLPLPVLTSKAWNHVAFLAGAGEGGRWAALAVRKPAYAARWAGTGVEGWRERLAAEPDAALFELGAGPLDDLLPGLLDRLCAMAVAGRSYVHLVTVFPGHDEADRLESRLYAVKEWGTPDTPGPLLQKYVGRLHYLDPARPPAGFRIARGAAAEAVVTGNEKG